MSPRKSAAKRKPGRAPASRGSSSRKAPTTAGKKPPAKAASKAAAKAPKAPGKARAKATRSTSVMRIRAVASLRYARSILDGLFKDFPVDKHTYQPAMTDNHIIWTLGHLAITNQWFAGLLDGEPPALPDGYNELFGYKSKPNPDLAAYPPYDEVRQQYEAAFARLIRAADALRDSDLTISCAAESGGFAKDKAEVLERAVWHEGWHGGQVSALRRSLGLPPVMG